jgi:hypothetical protein
MLAGIIYPHKQDLSNSFPGSGHPRLPDEKRNKWFDPLLRF